MVNRVPSLQANGSITGSFNGELDNRQPSLDPLSLLTISNRATAAMDASASPLNPRVFAFKISSGP